MRHFDEVEEMRSKERYYEFKESAEYKLRELHCNIADELRTHLSTIEIRPQNEDFYHIIYAGYIIGYIYKIENDFLVRFFKELA